MSGSWVTVPRWTPDGVKNAIVWLVNFDHPDDQAAILTRLITDPRMKTVWGELAKRDRKTAQFLHTPTAPRERYKGDPGGAQQDLMGETFWLAFDAARNKRMAATQEELNRVRKKWLAKATTFNRDAQKPWVTEADAAAFRRSEQIYREAATSVRTGTDPATVLRHRGDPLTRGVQITISCFFESVIGERLDRTAATLTAVALGKAAVSHQAGRSAINRR